MVHTAFTDPRRMYSTAIHLLHLYDRTACRIPQCLHSTAIPLLSLWAVQSLQSFSACRVQLYLYSRCRSSRLYRASVPVQYRYTSSPPMGRTVFTVPQSLYSTAIPLLPYRPYGLYRASVPVQYSYTSTPPMGRTASKEHQCLYSTAIPLFPSMGRTACADPQSLYSTSIPLLPLWAVRSLKALSACTVQIYLYSPYGHYSLYRPSMSVQYSYTSTPLIGHTAFTDPQCLYRTAIPLLPS